jgi:hypothetical protein
MRPLIVVELNEINFPFVQRYVAQGELPTFSRLIEDHGYSETTSETVYENIEPWIQWVTAHTGKPFEEHGIFRLGDFVGSRLTQIWEQIEQAGGRVGAVSPMNAENRLKAGFFVPDPWTPTAASGSHLLRGLSRAISQAVNDNAQAKVSLVSRIYLMLGILVYGGWQHIGAYRTLLRGTRDAPWRKAMLLDRLLSDVFMDLWRKERPDFATIFLNAGAHIQHHYLFNSAVYSGKNQNPHWYLPQHHDPVLEVYRLYDSVLRDILAMHPDTRVMVATGLHQDPHDRVTYYYRLIDHAAFLGSLGIRFKEVSPRMSRDFVVHFEADIDAKRAEQVLASGQDMEGIPLFEVDNRGSSLFVTLTYPNEIVEEFTVSFKGKSLRDFHKCVAFVAIKNGHHNGVGYFIDTARRGSGPSSDTFPLHELWDRMLDAVVTP